MIACGIAKLSDAQMKKLHKGLPVRVKPGTAHQVNLPPAQAKKLAKAKANNKGMILSFPTGGSLFGDAKNWYENAIPAKYRAPLETMATMGAQDAGIIDGGSLFGDAKNYYQNVIPAKYRAPLEAMATMGAQDAGIIDGSGGRPRPKGRPRGKGLVPNIHQLVDAQNQLAVYNPVQPIRGKGALAILAKHPVASRHHLVRHHMAGAGMHGMGWREDLASVGNKVYGEVKKLDPEGKLRRKAVSALAQILVPKDEEGKSNETAKLATELIGNYITQDATVDKVPQGKKKGRKPRKQSVMAEEILPSEYSEKALTAYTQPLPTASISSAFEDQVPYQPVRWFGAGLKKGTASTKSHMDKIRGVKLVKGSPEAKQYMANLRAMRKGNQGGALYPAGQMSGKALLPAGYTLRDLR